MSELDKLTEETLVKHQMERRLLIWSTKFGIYLGRHGGVKRWSIWNPGNIKSAPTYNKEEAERLMTKMTTDEHTLETMYVFPDLEGKRASENACTNVGLSRWISYD